MNLIFSLLCIVLFLSVLLAQYLGARGLAQFLLFIYVALIIIYFPFASKLIYKKNKELFADMKNKPKQETNDPDKNKANPSGLPRIFKYGSVKFYAAALTVVIGWIVVIFLFIWIRRHSM